MICELLVACGYVPGKRFHIALDCLGSAVMLEGLGLRLPMFATSLVEGFDCLSLTYF